MKYEWEKEITLDILDSLNYTASEILPRNIKIFAVAFCDDDSAEACLIYMPSEWSGVLDADMCGDVLGDAKEAYSQALKKTFRVV